jgi:hypothetical protein
MHSSVRGKCAFPDKRRRHLCSYLLSLLLRVLKRPAIAIKGALKKAFETNVESTMAISLASLLELQLTIWFYY